MQSAGERIFKTDEHLAVTGKMVDCFMRRNCIVLKDADLA